MRTPTFLFLALAGLTACGGGGGGGNAPLDASGGTARQFSREESAVTALPNTSGGFTATRVVTLSNDDGGATAAVASLANPVGGITSSAGTSGYQIQVTLRADGSTEQQARDALASMSVVHRDGLGAGTLYLDNEVKFAPYSQNNANRTATVAATLPPDLDYRLGEYAGVGAVTSTGLSGELAELITGTGDATLSGTWDEVDAEAGTGDVTVSGDIASLQAATSTGSVSATLPGMRETDAELYTSVGSIDVTVSTAAGAGFDLEGWTQVGSVLILVAGTEPVGTQSDEHGHYRSPDYASSNPQVRVAGATSVGDVLIHQ
jgi:hypothetical protein